MTCAAYSIAWVLFLIRYFFPCLQKDKLLTVNNFCKCRPNGNDRLRNRQPLRTGHGLTLETSALLCFHGGNLTFVNLFDTKFKLRNTETISTHPSMGSLWETINNVVWYSGFQANASGVELNYSKKGC